jgi:hypothetical protein
MQMAIEWQIMQVILRNGCGADIEKIMESFEKLEITKNEIFECIARLMQTGIIEFSIGHYDFIFHPDAAISPLVRALKTKKSPPITLDEYQRFCWRKLAGLGPKEDK